MTRHLPRPGLSRRGLLKGASALGASSLLLPFGMQAAMAQPRSGGILRVALGHGSASDGYDPATWTNDFAAFFAATRHGYLTEIGADGQLIGEIAQSWQTVDAVTWVLKIRSGLSFHSGQPLTVEDVIASLNHHRGRQSAVGPLVDHIASLRADGGNLIVTLAAPNVDFPLLLADYHLPVMPAVNGRLDLQSPDGCGAYRVVAYEPGVLALLERNPSYWKSGRAHMDGVEIVTLFDPAARLAALRSGVVDLIDGLESRQVAGLKHAPGVKVTATRGTRHAVLAMDSSTVPFHDPHLRLALKSAIDRPALVTDVLQGHGQIGNDHPIAPSSRYFNTELVQTTFDPDRARFHLGRAGINGIDLTLTTAEAAFAGAGQAAEMFAQTVATAGINLKINQVAGQGYWSQVWRQTPFCASSSIGRPTEDWVFSTAYAGGSPWNDGHWINTRFDTLLGWARSELDETLRRDMYWEMQAISAQDGAVIIPFFADELIAHSENLAHDDTLSRTAPLDGYRAAERWWFA